MRHVDEFWLRVASMMLTAHTPPPPPDPADFTVTEQAMVEIGEQHRLVCYTASGTDLTVTLSGEEVPLAGLEVQKNEEHVLFGFQMDR